MQDENAPEGTGIQPPKRHPAANAGRAIARAVGGAVPVAGSFIAEAADALLPDPEATDRKRWEGEVTDGVNTLRGDVDDIDRRTGKQTVTLSEGASAAAKYLVEHCPDGLARHDVTFAEIKNACPDLSRDALLDGLGDLENFGLVETESFIGAPDEYRLTQTGYEVLDPPIMGWSPMDDARQLAALVVGRRDDVRTSELEVALGWPRRRFNPALRIVAGFIRTIEDRIQPHYVTTGLYPTNAEFAQLRRFAAGE